MSNHLTLFNPIKVTNGTAIVMKESTVLSFFGSGNSNPEKDVIASIIKNTDVIKEEELKLFLNGTDNLFPNNLQKVLSKSPIYKVGLQYSGQQLMGAGLQKGALVIEDSQEYFNPVKYPKWDFFEKKSHFITEYFIPACKNIKTYYQVFALISLSANKTIAKVSVLNDARCRIVGDPKTGEKKYCVVRNWNDASSNQMDINNPDTSSIYPIIDSWYDPIDSLNELIKKFPNIYDFVLYVSIPSDGLIYSKPEHFSIVESGLIDYANNIVNFKSWIMKNMTTLNQILYISREYLLSSYPEWQSWENDASQGGKKGEDAKKKMDNVYDSLSAKFKNSNSGIDKGGKMVIAPLLENDHESIKVVKVDQNTFDSQYNEDANWVEKQIQWAIQIDAGQYSSVDGKNNNGGSNKTQTFNIAQLNEWMFEQFIMIVPQFVSDFNQFDVEAFRIRRSTMYSSDAVSAKDRHIQPPTNPKN